MIYLFPSATIELEQCLELQNFRSVYVSFADGWHQPQLIENIKDLAISDDSQTLLRLTDKCLLNIYKYLEPSDVVNLANSCTRLKDFAVKNIYKNYKHIEMDDQDITLYSFQHFLIDFGSFVESATMSLEQVNFVHRTYFHLLSLLMLCPNIHSIKICCWGYGAHNEYVDLPPPPPPKWYILLEKLNVIELKDCYFITDEWNDFLYESCPNLSCVAILNNSNITGRIWSAYKNLKSLVLIRCTSLDELALTKVIQNNANTLRSIQIDDRASFRLIPIIFSNIVHEFDLNLIITKFNSEYYADFKHFKCVHKLRLQLAVDDISHIGTSISDLVLRMIAPYLPELQIFQVKSFFAFSEQSLVEFVRCCTKLEFIDIDYCCKLTLNAVQQIIEILKTDCVTEATDDGNDDDVQQQRRRRPMLNFNIELTTGIINKDLEQLLADNRHLLTVTIWEMQSF